MFQTKVVEEIKKNFEFNDGFKNSCRLWYYVETFCMVEQTTDDSMVDALCMLDT